MDTVKTLLAATLLSGALGLLITQSCSKEKQDDKKVEVKPDVKMLDYLEYAPMDYLTVFKRSYRELIPKEGYTYYEMPFEDGFVKYEGSQIPCKKHPTVYWKKVTEEAECIVTVYFDCKPQYLSHTSECNVL